MQRTKECFFYIVTNEDLLITSIMTAICKRISPLRTRELAKRFGPRHVRGSERSLALVHLSTIICLVAGCKVGAESCEIGTTRCSLGVCCAAIYWLPFGHASPASLDVQHRFLPSSALRRVHGAPISAVCRAEYGFKLGPSHTECYSPSDAAFASHYIQVLCTTLTGHPSFCCSISLRSGLSSTCLPLHMCLLTQPLQPTVIGWLCLLPSFLDTQGTSLILSDYPILICWPSSLHMPYTVRSFTLWQTVLVFSGPNCLGCHLSTMP
jgi:hypothetical protein